MLLAFAFLMFSASNFIYDPFGLWLHSKMHERITPEVDLRLSQEAEWKSKNLIFHCSRTSWVQQPVMTVVYVELHHLQHKLLDLKVMLQKLTPKSALYPFFLKI